jgi:hypothetical protein
MTGGLLQIVTSGKQDIYLTINPQITFFKKVYRRHTNFALELKEFNSTQTPEFNNNITFNINVGDAIHRCYFEIDLPNLSFSDKYITNTTYYTSKSTKISNYQSQSNILLGYYVNLKGYCDIEIQLYRSLYTLLQSENITINDLKSETTKFNYKNKTTKDTYKNKIDEKVYNLIDITGYINSINKLITNLSVYDTNLYISRTEILNQLDICFNNMTKYLNYYNKKKVECNNKILQLQKTQQINFSWAEYLGHNFFEKISLEIGGQEFEKYDNDIMHINQMHHVKPDDMPNYLEMIGHTPQLFEFNTDSKGGRKILVPLIYWFNKDAGSSLPLVAMQYSTVIINAKINDIHKIVTFENYEKIYDTLLIVTIENQNETGFKLNTKLIYSKYKLNAEEKSITYYCNIFNDELLRLQFPDLTTTEISIILTNNGSETYSGSGIYLMDKKQWIGFMLDIKNPIYSTLAPKVASYYPFINFNQYYSMIPSPKIKLITESVFLDDIERSKFANSKLEYVIEKFNTDIFDIKNSSFDCELSFNDPCKELLWFIKPQLYLDSITENSKNIELLYDTYKYFISHPIMNQKLTFNQTDVIFNNVDFNYWTNMLSYKFLNNILPNGIYYNSFCLYPEETQPSGTVNLRHIKAKQYRLEFNPSFLTEYYNYLKTIYKNNNNLIKNKKSIQLKFIAKSYNLLVINKGQAKLMFEN